MNPVFVTGGTGYIGRPLIEALLARRHTVHALARPASAGKLPSGARAVIGDALDAATFAAEIPAGATFVHLVGTPHPNPSKAEEFKRVDLASIHAAATAAQQAAVDHFVYMSVAHPAPVMHAYITVRQEGEAVIRATRIRTTILRPWYILGP
ncbi:MAG TPA: NAD(P)-dependent oxidoreductase, partial [Vicinamibacterales bacterium]|nr:NAD(P)-dependent oxidoreductase [Vicinamibacterales bacterium]